MTYRLCRTDLFTKEKQVLSDSVEYINPLIRQAFHETMLEYNNDKTVSYSWQDKGKSGFDIFISDEDYRKRILFSVEKV